MSAPAPRSVNEPLLPLALPDAPTLPMSRADQPLGTPCAPTGAGMPRAMITKRTRHEVGTPRVTRRSISHTAGDLEGCGFAWKVVLNVRAFVGERTHAQSSSAKEQSTCPPRKR